VQAQKRVLELDLGARHRAHGAFPVKPSDNRHVCAIHHRSLAHTEEVLAETDLSEQEIALLRAGKKHRRSGATKH
jgi:hypothetical protein